MKRAFLTVLAGLARTLAIPCLISLVFCALDPAVARALDPASAECIGCHETSVDPEFPGLVCHAEGCNHAIGVDYGEAARTRPSLAPPSELTGKVRLTGGAIGCTTCHVPYSRADHKALSDERAEGTGPDPMLAVDNAGSALCLVCHRM